MVNTMVTKVYSNTCYNYLALSIPLSLFPFPIPKQNTASKSNEHQNKPKSQGHISTSINTYLFLNNLFNNTVEPFYSDTPRDHGNV